ncbi:flavoprotein family protein [Peptoniphilus sp. oral taxon 375 str. F0436]|nr:flavoprotein family protein [Peptoniphilus sp. oral taxon 375 str. F0436]
MKIAIIGGGPAGMMAGIIASRHGQVSLFEKNEKLGKKLYITGKGRCNITNNKDISEFFPALVRNPEFLYSAFYQFTNQDLQDLIPLTFKVERGDRVFPKSDKSSDVISALEKMLREAGVQVYKNTPVLDLEKKGHFLLKTKEGTQAFDRVILATGGKSYPVTGSTGDGYGFAQKFGHSLVPLRGGLVGILLKDSFVKDLEGLSLRNVSLKAQGDGKLSLFGEALFTGQVLSGPIALTMSSYINRWEKVDLALDLKPGLTLEKLDQAILRDFQEGQNKEIQTILAGRLPHRLVDVFLSVLDLDPHQKVNETTKAERRRLVEGMKNFPLHYGGLDKLDHAIITSGGVDVKEIDPSSMESKKVPGLYFCGEVLDLDALTGGYNLQIAFSTGHLAGESVGKGFEKS